MQRGGQERRIAGMIASGLLVFALGVLPVHAAPRMVLAEEFTYIG
jgi:hypothetical protein